MGDLLPTALGLPVKFLAAYGRQEVLEGPVPEGVAIAEFPSMEEAKQWYESPAYQARQSIDSKVRPIAVSLLKALTLKVGQSAERLAQSRKLCRRLSDSALRRNLSITSGVSRGCASQITSVF
jgi:hypothetical protein